MLHKPNNRPESPTVTLTWHASKYKVQKLHQRYILNLFQILIVTLTGTVGFYNKQIKSFNFYATLQK